MIRKSLAALLLLGAVSLQSCKSDTTGPDGGGNNVTNTKPKAGATYTYNEEVAPEGQQPTNSTVIYTVVQANATVGSKSSVYTFDGPADDDTRVIAYESNGNVSVLVPRVTMTGVDTVWMTIPVTGSGGSSNLLVADFDLDVFGIMVNTKVNVTATAAGTENITVGSKSFAAKKIKVTNKTTVTMPGVPATTETADDYFWWVPEIGYYAKNQETSRDEDTDDVIVTTETLTSFDID
ncbi:MAG TPA: hypothetical protein VFH43_11725 [Candidatus Kapabacteria bacterium]|nr:hypothetical protein [Candidatus Kapabacteria bacterium]